MHAKTIYVQARDARGRMFHRPTEYDASKGLWGALPGGWIGFDNNGQGIVPLRFNTELRDGERPTFVYIADRWCCIGAGEVLLENAVGYGVCGLKACVARHAAQTECDRCGGPRGGHHWLIDARTVAEPVYCSPCRVQFELRVFEQRTRYQEIDCACGAWCYVQVRPKPTERGVRNDVMPCPKCKALCCEACLPDGAKQCRACIEKRKAA